MGFDRPVANKPLASNLFVGFIFAQPLQNAPFCRCQSSQTGSATEHFGSFLHADQSEPRFLAFTPVTLRVKTAPVVECGYLEFCLIAFRFHNDSRGLGVLHHGVQSFL